MVNYPSVPELKEACDAIMKHYQESLLPKKYVFLGTRFEEWFETTQAASFLLANFEHALAIKYSEEEHTWVLYDSNIPEGCKRLDKSEIPHKVLDCLGTLIVLEQEEGMPYPSPHIPDSKAFLSNGGLHTLLQLRWSSSDVAGLINQLPQVETLSEHALHQSLLLRNGKGQPAWKQGLESLHPGIKQYTEVLLQHLARMNPQNYAKVLAQSIAKLPEYEQNACLLELQEAPWAFALCAHLNAQQEEAYFTKQLTPWKKRLPKEYSLEAYLAHLVTKDRSKRLVYCASSEAMEALGVAFQHYCHIQQYPVYYINSPEELVCSSSYIKRTGSKGVIEEGPGGALHEFLIRPYEAHNPPKIGVNYDEFTPADRVRLNSLLDNKTPKADGTPLPPGTQVIGFMNPNKPGCYQGSDFYSRFGLEGIETCPTSILFPTPPVIPNKPEEMKEVVSLDFCHAGHWKEILLGRWGLCMDTLRYQEGVLQQALQSGYPIHLHNGLWDDEAFRHFWYQAQMLGFIEWEGTRYPLQGHTLVRSEGYCWEELNQSLCSIDYQLRQEAEVLNPSRFGAFFERYMCTPTQKLITVPGVIESHRLGKLKVNVTRSLSDDEWALVLLECQKHGVSLECHCAPGVFLPKACANRILWTLSPIPRFKSPHRIIESTDVDASLARLHKEQKEFEVIDVSECDSSDVLVHLDGVWEKQTHVFRFVETRRAVLKALEAQKTVILKGYFSPELADALAPLLLNHKKGQLLLLSEDTRLFPYLPVEHHVVCAEEKEALLKAGAPYDEALITHLSCSKYSLSQLTAQLAYAKAFGDYSEEAPWQGLKGLSGGMTCRPLDTSCIQERANAFVAQRQQAVEALLAYSPYVVLTGLSGVGKSTFVEKQLKAASRWIGEGQLIRWAEDKTEGRKLLFLDEANLTSRQWSEFEGLFETPPHLWIKGKKYLLTPEHKVLFAGNPLNYGGERTLPSLFARHGAALIFEPMPLEFIYEAILKPVFDNTPWAPQSLAIGQELLSLYEFLAPFTQEEVLISPRELQMMALMVLSCLQTHPEANPLALTTHYAFLIAKPLVPEPHRRAFNKRWAPLHTPSKTVQVLSEDFVLTASREALYHYVSDVLALRDLRRLQKAHLNEAQLYGGLGGLILEGEAGIGKSELVLTLLHLKGYQEVTLSTPEDQVPEKAFYLMPPSMQPKDQEQLVLKAFQEGALVLIDELNSIPVMEDLWNELLMGKYKNNRPIHPGFMIIGTQNPVTLGGRYSLSPALKRRFTTLDLPPYPKEELVDILQVKGLSKEHSELMVSVYLKQHDEAKRRHLTPEPTVRGLTECAIRYAASLKTSAQYGFFSVLRKNNPIKESRNTPPVLSF